MKRPAMMILAASLAGGCVLCAQTINPLIAEAKQQYDGVKNYLLKAADKMPEENYSFKPTPELQTFANASHTSPVKSASAPR